MVHAVGGIDKLTLVSHIETASQGGFGARIKGNLDSESASNHIILFAESRGKHILSIQANHRWTAEIKK